VKTALVYRVKELDGDALADRRADLAASFERAIVEQLATKLERALDAGEWPAVALGGGVAANSKLRDRVAEVCEERGLRLKLVPLSLCTDNAAMIAAAARHLPAIPYPDYLSYDAFAN
jgi:N6-L-threonylcarbamoyladenine synthase